MNSSNVLVEYVAKQGLYSGMYRVYCRLMCCL